MSKCCVCGSSSGPLEWDTDGYFCEAVVDCAWRLNDARERERLASLRRWVRTGSARR